MGNGSWVTKKTFEQQNVDGKLGLLFDQQNFIIERLDRANTNEQKLRDHCTAQRAVCTSYFNEQKEACRGEFSVLKNTRMKWLGAGVLFSFIILTASLIMNIVYVFKGASAILSTVGGG